MRMGDNISNDTHKSLHADKMFKRFLSYLRFLGTESLHDHN